MRTVGSTDVERVSRRPRMSCSSTDPAAGRSADETAADFAARLLAELREGAPREVPGRRRTAARYRAALNTPAAPDAPDAGDGAPA